MTANDTIAAIATAPGAAGVGVVRLSGPLALPIAKTICGELPRPRSMQLSRFSGESGMIDQGLVVIFPGPSSFTGEDVVELHCHGGRLIPNMVLDAALAQGARRAEPGEFSLRAFLGGKMDLTQAEAIADLVSAGSERAAKAALRSLAGEFSQQVQALTAALIRIRAEVEAGLDFPDEELPLVDGAQTGPLRSWLTDCESLLARTRYGRSLTDGLQIVIAGAPNAGKSSLLNRLAGYEAAIVTDTPGTTRDALKEQLEIDGFPIRMLDTAGLRDSEDPIEVEGVRRTRAALGESDHVLWIADVRDGVDAALRAARQHLVSNQGFTLVLNKIDLLEEDPGEVQGDVPTVKLSALTGDGLPILLQRIKAMFGSRESGEGIFSARARHVDALNVALAHVSAALEQAPDSPELAAEELRVAQEALNGITGEFSSDDLLGEIFSNFCIGK